MKKILIYGILIGGLILAVSKPTQSGKDQTQAWKDYRDRRAYENAIYKAGEAERNQKKEYASIMLDPYESWKAETYYKYRYIHPECGYPVWEGEFVHEKPIMPTMDYSPYFEKRYCDEPPRYTSQQEQPDLTGLYYSRTIVGPNAGNWSINFVSGP
jgi:hypothetical protein